jgi:hypothetical protein
MNSIASVALVLSVSAAAVALPAQEDRKPRNPVPSHVLRAEEMTAAARAWLGSLSPDLYARALLPFDDASRTAWGYMEAPESGLAFGELSGEQRVLLDRLVRTGLSAEGYLRAHSIVVLEDVLGRDPGAYRAVVYGDPAGEDPWAWSVEGHHLSLNFTVKNGKFVTGTPMFLGADPAEVQGGIHAGLAPFHEMEAQARDLIGQMRGPHAAAAIRAEDPPGDVLFGPGKEMFAKAEGVSIGALPRRMHTQVMSLVLGAMVGNLHPGLQTTMMNRYRFHDLGDIGLLWIGSQEPGEAFYLRISSLEKDFAVEYVNRGNHVHLLVRDGAEDFGAQQIDAWK